MNIHRVELGVVERVCLALSKPCYVVFIAKVNGHHIAPGSGVRVVIYGGA